MEHDSPEGFMRERDALNRLLTSKADRVIKRFLSIDSLAYGEGALKADVKELLGLTASAVLRCDDCIRYHILRCKEEGVGEEEVFETLHLKAEHRYAGEVRALIDKARELAAETSKLRKATAWSCLPALGRCRFPCFRICG